MAAVLTHVSDRYKAFALWQAGLLVNQYGALWGEADQYTVDPAYRSADASGFMTNASDWYIILED